MMLLLAQPGVLTFGGFWQNEGLSENEERILTVNILRLLG